MCSNFDCASVMLGKDSGVIARIWNEIPQIVPIHYAAQKLELDVLDAVKSKPFIKYVSTIRGLLIIYRASQQ